MVDISVDDIGKITLLVKEKMGYDFSDYAFASFKRRIERMIELKFVHSVEDLLYRITTETISKEQFLKELTVNVTEMFRDPGFWVALKALVQVKLKEQGNIRIWHAGCASGEEVFSILIMLKELNVLDRVEIIASDIDIHSIQSAQKGLMSARNMDQNNVNFLEYNHEGVWSDYFKKEGSYFIFDLELLGKVRFVVSDLTNAEPVPSCDFIFCRNVMIYFNHKLQNQVLDLFLKSLNMNGYLLLGAKESIAWCEKSTRFLASESREPIYRKVKV